MAATQQLLSPSDVCDVSSVSVQADFLKALCSARPLSSSFFAEPAAAVRVPTARQQSRLDERLTALEGRAVELEASLVQKLDVAAVERRLEDACAAYEARVAQLQERVGAALNQRMEDLDKKAEALATAQQKSVEELRAAASVNQAMLLEQLQMCSTTVEQRCAAIDGRFDVEHEQQKESFANFSSEMEQVLQMQNAAQSQALLEASRRTTQANAQALQIQGDAQSKALREVSEGSHAALKGQAAEQRKALHDCAEAADSALRQVSDRLEAMLKASRQASQTGIEDLTERLDALMLNLAEEIASCHEQVTKSQGELTKDLQARQEKLSEVLDESKRQFNSILDERVSEISSAAEGGRGFLAARIDETNDRLESMAGSMTSGRLMDLEDQVSLVALGLKKKADKDDLEESATEFAEKIKTSEGSTNAALEELRQKKADASKLDEHVAELAGNLQSRITDAALEKRLHDLTSQLTVVMDEQIDLAKESNRWKGVDDQIQSRKNEKLDSIAIDDRIKEHLEIRRLKDGLATTTKMITTLMSTLNAKDGALR